MDGPLLIRSSGAGTDTRWAQICRSVRDALTRRSPTQRIADRVVGIFVPLVLSLGALTALYWAQWLPFDRALLIGLCGAGGCLPVCSRPCRSACDLARHRAAGAARLSGPRAWRARRTCARAAARFRQDGHAHVGQSACCEDRDHGRRWPTRCSRGLPGWSAIPNMASAAPSPRRRQMRGLDPVVAGDVRTLPGRGIRGNADGEAVVAGNERFDERTGLVGRAGSRRTWAVAGGEWLFGDLCRMGRAGACRAVRSMMRRFPRRDRRSKRCAAAGCT